MRVVRYFLVLFSVSVRWKVTINKNATFTDCASGIWLLDCSKLTINWKNDNDVTICWRDIIVTFFWRSLVSFVKFNYWSKIHVNIITGSGVMTIFFYMGLTRNLEIKNINFWVLPSIWTLRQVRDTKFGTNVSNKRMLWNAAKCQGYSFNHFWVIKENKGRR